ncbi:MAG: beta strand repeat-containing protein, partial [Flavobacteriales bacterium]
MNTIYFRKLKKFWSMTLAFLMALFMVNEGASQTNPPLYNGWPTNYTFASWNDTEPANTFPANMRFWRTGTQDPTLLATANADYTLAYNLTTGSRINGLGANGFSFINTGTSGNLGMAVLGLNLSGRQNVQVSWTGGTVVANPRVYRIRLQYRIGASGTWTDVPGPIEYESNATAGHSQNFGPTTLPTAVENESEVYLRWFYYYVSGTGARPQLRIDDITVSSSVSSAPSIVASASSITAPSYVFASSPTSTSFTIDGSNLTGNPTITAPTNFQVSLDNSTFSTNVNVPVSAGTFSPNPRNIFVRLAPGLSPFIYNGTLTITGGGISSPIDISLTGEVTGSNVIAEWNFEPPTLTNPASPEPSIGTGTAAFTGATYLAAGGVDPTTGFCSWTNSGSAWAFSPVTPADARFDFFTSTSNFSNIVLTFDMRFSNAAPRTVQVQYTTNGGTTWNNFSPTELNIYRFCNTRGGIDGTKFDVSNPLGSAAGDARLRLSLNLSAITAVNNNPQFGVRFLPATYQSTGDFRQANNVSNISTGGALRLDNILFSGTCSTPVVLANLTNLSNFSYLEGFGPSAAQSFVVQGNCLSGNVTVTAPTNFEVSTNVSSGYGSSINLTAVSGVLNPTTLYVRLISGLSASTTPYTGNISITSPSATTFNIALTGIVNSLPGAGNIVVVRADAAGSNNTTGTFLELEPSTASQTNPQNIFFIDGVGSASPTRFSGSATSTMYLSNSNDRSELYVTGAASNNPTGNTNTVLQRRVVRLNASSTLSSATTYTSASGQQPRSATSLNNTNMIIGDQNGTYTNSATSPSLSVNIRSVKAFGGIVYGLRASATEPAVNTVSTPTPNTVTGLPGIPNLNTAQDFVLISSGFNGATFDVLYILRSTSATAGNIDKYSLVSGTWIANGTYSTGIGGFGLTGTKFLVGAELYVTSGTGSTAANIVRRLEDANGYNQPINITSTVDLYTTAAGTTLKGVAFAPVATNAPVVNVTSTFIDNFNYTALPGPGGPSASQSFNVTGANLTDDVTITAPADFEVSLDNVNFFNSLTLTRSGTTLAGQPVTVRVRLKTGLTANTYLQALTLSTAGGINKFVNVRGVVIDPVPTVTVNASLINFTTFRNLASAAQTYTVSGQFLDGNISIASPAGYEHRVVGNPTFTTAPLTLVQTGGNVALTTIEIRLASGAIAVRNGNINITSLNSNNPTVAITGEVMPRVQISEIHYNPDDSQGFTDDNYEFIEFRNFENITVDISGYNVLGIEYTLPGTAGSVTIPANERIVLARNPASYSAVVPAARLFGWTGTGALSNSGETIALRTTQNNTVNSVTYGVAFPWANGANGNGPSLELVNQSTIDNNGNPYNWCAIGPNNGTPGASNTCGVTYYSTAPGVITDAIWALDPSTPALPTFPGFSSFSDVVVRHIVELNPTNTQTVRNLIINSTGRLWRNVSINSTDTTESSNEIRYINVHGSDVIVNGVLGNPNVNIIDLLGINLNGGTKTISGTGTINIGRIRKNSDNNTTVLNINANVRLGFNGTVMYNNHSGTASRFEVTLQAGRTLRTLHPAGGLSIDGTVGTAAGQRGGSYTINGTAIVGRFWHRENRGFNIDPTPNPGGVQTTIGSTGRLNVKDIFMQTSRVNSTNITTPFTINAGGRLTITDDGTLTLWSGDFNTNGGLFVNEGGAILHGNETPGTIPLSDPDRVTPNIIGTATIRRTGSPTVNNNK